MFHSLPQIAEELSETYNESSVAFGQQYKEKLREKSYFLQRIVFSKESNFPFPAPVTRRKCMIQVFHRPETIYESLQSCPTVMVLCNIFVTERIYLF